MKNLLLFILLIRSSYACSQQKLRINNKKIYISGTISDSLVNTLEKEPYIIFYDEYYKRIPARQQIIPLKTNNKFSVKLNCINKSAYFQLVIPGSPILTTSERMLFISQGDSVFMQVKDRDNVIFTGNGSEKLNYQLWAGKLKTPFKTWESFSNPERISYAKRYKNKHLIFAIDSLDKMSKNLDDSITNVLRYNVISNINLDFLLFITKFITRCDSTYHQILKDELSKSYNDQNTFLTKNPFVLNNSFMYTEYLFYLNGYYTQTMSETKNFPFIASYNKIMNQYSGLLRDKLITQLFLARMRFSEESINYLQNAIDTVNDKNSLDILLQMKSQMYPGNKAYNFNFEGLDKRPVKMEDFKGKILILDTYYTGCIPCMKLAREMKPIMQYFSNKKDVVFISLNALDKNRKLFIESAKSGKYGGKQTIYAWTGILKDRHPMITFYNYISYPNLLIIGKNGNIISTNPELPLDDSTKESMIKLIESYL